MMRQYELVERVQSYDPNADEALLNRAYVYAMKMHGSQKRASGDPYFSHPLEVAGLLTELKLDPATIVTALLHDTVEDTEATHEEIARLFGEEIAQLVDGVTKLTRLELTNEESKQAENFRKLLLAMSKDVRVLLVKLADRLHNMRTLHYVKSEEKRRRIAQETMDIYAPLAGRMGMQSFRDELEDLAFREVNPEASGAVRERLESKLQETEDLVVRISDVIKEKLAEQGIDARVSGRVKRPYSIWKKMEHKSISLEQLSDIIGFRVIVSTVDECYRTLGVVHTTWPTVPGRFKDYISTPKGNNYRSIHTTVVGPARERVELQIRTAEMHEVAEYGVAAHWFYKDYVQNGVPAAAADDLVAPFRWLRRIVEMLEHGSTPQEFLEHTKLEMFQDQVFCFTPKGRLIALPRGATPIDFAYAVHTDIGDRCAGARINGVRAPLRAELSNGDEVEIIVKDEAGPSAGWEAIVKTGKARAAIRAYRRKTERDEWTKLGRGILQAAVAAEGLAFSEAAVEKLLPQLPVSRFETLLEQLGQGMMSPEPVVQLLAEQAADKRRARRSLVKGAAVAAAAEKARAKGIVPRNRPGAIPIRGVGQGTAIQISPVSQPVPGDRIIGILMPGQGVEVYRIDSPSLVRFDRPEDQHRWVDLAWDVDPKSEQLFATRVELVMANEPGALGEVATLIGKLGANIENLTTLDRKTDYYTLSVDVGVRDAKHVERVLAALRELSCVAGARRVSG